MHNLEQLYRQVIMDHYKNPRNKGLIGHPKVHLYNPSCGDDVTVEANITNNTVQEIHHDGSGCSICCSSASVMSEVLTGKTVDEAKSIVQLYFQMIMGQDVEEEKLEEAMVYQGVAKFPARIKCATIAWKAIERILVGEVDE